MPACVVLILTIFIDHWFFQKPFVQILEIWFEAQLPEGGLEFEQHQIKDVVYLQEVRVVDVGTSFKLLVQHF